MASHRTRFTLGSHIRFGCLDFLCTAVDHDLVLLPPSVSIDHVAGTEEELIPLPPSGSADPPSDVDFVTKSMGSLHLHATEAQAFEGSRPLGIDYPWLERQLDGLLGPHPSPEALHDLYFAFANVMAQLAGGPPLSPELVSATTQLVWPQGLHNVARTYERHGPSASLLSPRGDLCMGLPNHHLQSISEMASKADSYEHDGG
jgi:hypothetical protein